MKVILLGFICVFLNLSARCQNAFDYYVSNSGNDTSAGNSSLRPKKTIAAVVSTVSTGSLPRNPLKIGFKSGDVFNETFAPGFPVEAGTYFPSGIKNEFAIFNGTAKFDTGWVRTDSTSNIYEQSIQLSGFTGYGINGVGQYSFVSVFEIDRLIEQTAPFTARRVLKFYNSIQTADLIPGSFYEPITQNVNPVKIFIHTSDGSSPNNNPRYRYEVTIRDRAINSTFQENNYFERMWVRGFGAGNGMIPTGANSAFNRMIFGPAAGIHHLVLRGASINNSLFLPSALNTNGYAVVFYDTEGFRRHNSIKNSIFLDIKYPVYTHTSYGAKYAALELDNVIAFADTLEGESFVETANNDSIILNNTYANGFKTGYNYGHAAYFSARNSSLLNAFIGFSFGNENLLSSINNCFVKTRGNIKTTGLIISKKTNLILANSIFHITNYNNWQNFGYTGVFIDNAGGDSNHVNARGNIFIADVEPSKNVLAASSTVAGAGSDWQNNVYILLRGNRIDWRIRWDNTPGSPSISVSFDEWKRRTGYDIKSLFFDLRNDPRGLKAIFIDPDNGDYSLANTIEANKIREIRAGMVNPVNCFLKKPSYEEAAKIIINDGVLSANVCRNPCIQNNIRVSHQFTESAPGGTRVQLQWNLAGEEGIERYEIQRSWGNSDFLNIGHISASGVGNYNFIDSNVQVGVTYNYSLVVVTKTGEKCYSQVRAITLKDGQPLNVYPNPSPGLFMVSVPDYSGKITVTITNVSGVKVLSKDVNNVYGVPLKIDLSEKSKGIYWLKVQVGDKSYFKSIMVR